MAHNDLILAAAESHTWEGVNPWAVGVITLLILLGLLGALVAFGAGREHS
ncbi:hypothetical protein [Nocardioides solisilvae]|nr:hypothetical protein [Nocardioides solisilvae]